MTTDAEHWGERHFASLSIGLAALHFVLGLLVFEPTLFPGGDNAGYLILGDALRSGEGYRDLYLPDTPLHTRYPPLLPALLAVLGWIGGVGVAKVTMLLFTAATVWATAHFGRRWVGVGPGLAAAGVLAVNPTLLEYGHYILSEAPFTLLVVAALWLSIRPGRRSAAWAMLAATAAFATRTAGMTVLFALPLAWLLGGQRRRAAWSGAVAAGVLGAWALYQRLASEGPGYLAELRLVNPYVPEVGTVSLAGLVTRAADNCWTYLSQVLPDVFLGTGSGSGAGFALGVLVATAALAGWVIHSRQAVRGPEAFLLLYAALIALWPSVWTDRRFLLPLVPVVLLLAFAAIQELPPPSRRWLTWAATALLATLGSVWVIREAPARLACAASYGEGRPCHRPEYESFYAAARWAGANTHPDAIIANRKPRLFFWHARRRGDVYPFSFDPEIVMDGLDGMGADYVVVDWLSLVADAYLIPAIRDAEARFEPVFAGGDPATLIFRIVQPTADAD